MTLKTLYEANQEMLDRLMAMRNRTPLPNGIACPQCGNELDDICPGERFMSNPPQQKIACGKCGWSGTRVSP